MPTGLRTNARAGRGIYENDSLSARRRRYMLILAAAIVVVFLTSLCIRVVNPGFVSPSEAFTNLATWVKLAIARVSGSALWLGRFETIEALGPGYYDSIERFITSVISFACGMLLALSGHIFQTIFRNPIAAPTMIGVSAGVRLGVVMLYLNYGTAALVMPLEKYKYCYLCALAAIGLCMLLARISSGRRRFSATGLLIIAAITQQIMSAVTEYVQLNLDNDQALILRRVQNQTTVDTSSVSLIALALVFVLSVVPFFLMRYSFNAVAFDTDDSSSMGLNTGFVKLIALVLATLMTVAGMVHLGMVAMVSLIVPFIARGFFGVESRGLFWGNLLIGGLLMLLCKDIAALIPFPGEGMPVGAIVEMLTLPVFVLILIKKNRTWE